MTASLSELSGDINKALVRMGKSSWRREFNTRLWSCNRENALKIIREYHDRLVRLARTNGWDEADLHLSSSLRS